MLHWSWRDVVSLLMHTAAACTHWASLLCREMVDNHMPHLSWNDELPPICSFYSYATVRLRNTAAVGLAPAELVAPKVPSPAMHQP